MKVVVAMRRLKAIRLPSGAHDGSPLNSTTRPSREAVAWVRVAVSRPEPLPAAVVVVARRAGAAGGGGAAAVGVGDGEPAAAVGDLGAVGRIDRIDAAVAREL